MLPALFVVLINRSLVCDGGFVWLVFFFFVWVVVLWFFVCLFGLV